MPDFTIVETIFFAALQKQAGPERTAYLNEACGTDADLLNHVERMLAAHPQVGSFLKSPPSGLLATVDSTPLTERLGTIIGPYKLLQQIGEGGMGVVYMADQEQPIRRRVALKIIKPGMDSKQVIARFEAERQALAMMDHTNIARVLDAGTTESSRPYFVMELVHGLPITKYCDENKLTPRERLELFVPVCQAIQHAHQKGVIHRDIKPSNVLVTMYDDKPVPKVIDFGVAKAVEQRLTENTLFTQYGTMVGTFEYMSPEQAEMNAFGVDTRSDVYSLGVLLYELLTGTTPLEKKRIRTAALDELVRLIREEEPPRPSARLSTSGDLPSLAASRRTEPARLAGMVRGEVDWIVMKCLEKDRTRRYETANSLAKDVERYLADEQVEACPPSAGYRLRKFARRYQAPLTAAAIFTALLLAGIVISTWQAVRATKAEREAVQAEKEALVQQKVAVDAEKRAYSKQEEAETAKKSLRQSLYASDLLLAQSAWDTGNLVRTSNLLERQKPRQGETDLRGFEWFYLNQLKSQTRILSLGRTGGQLSLDSTRYVTYHFDGTPEEPKRGRELRLWDTATGALLKSHIPIYHPSGGGFEDISSYDNQRFAVAIGRSDLLGNSPELPWMLRVWEWETDRTFFTCDLPGPPLAMVFDRPARRMAALVTRGKNVDKNGCDFKIWEVESGKELFSIPVTDRKGLRQARSSSFSPDGKYFVALTQSPGPDDSTKTAGEVIIWDAGSGKELHRFSAGPGTTKASLVFSPDGSRLAICGDGLVPIRRWDTNTWKEALELTFPVQAGWVRSIAYSPDGTQLAGACGDGNVRLWDVSAKDHHETSRLIRTLSGPNEILQYVAFSKDGRFIRAAGIGKVVTWEVDIQTEPVVIRGPLWSDEFAGTPPVASIDATLFAALFEPSPGKSELKVWNDKGAIRFQTTDLPRAINTKLPGLVKFNNRGTHVVYMQSDFETAKGNSTVVVWDLDTKKELFRKSVDKGSFIDATLSPDGQFVATQWYSMTTNNDFAAKVTVWNLNTNKEVRQLEVPAATELVFSPDGKLLAGIVIQKNFSDSELRVWNLEIGETITKVLWRDNLGAHLVFSPDGSLLAVALNFSMSNEIKLVETVGGKERLTLHGHRYWVNKMAFSPDGKRLASAATPFNLPDAEVKIWDMASGLELMNLPAKGPGSLAFSSDGRHLSYVSMVGEKRDAQIQVWDGTPLEEKSLK